MAKRLLDYDPLSGVTTWHDYDPVTDITTIATEQDCEPFIEIAKTLQNDDDYRKNGIKQSWSHVAIYPVGVQYKWLKDYGVNVYDKTHWPRVRRLLNDPDWRYLRTTTGKV